MTQSDRPAGARRGGDRRPWATVSPSQAPRQRPPDGRPCDRVDGWVRLDPPRRDLAQAHTEFAAVDRTRRKDSLMISCTPERLTDTGDELHGETSQPALSEKSASQPGRGPMDCSHSTTHASFPSPPAHADTEPDQNDMTGDIPPTTTQATGNPVPLLYTPAQAAAALQVPESWLRRRAARRDVPCTFLGKHLRFSQANLEAIVIQAARETTPPPRCTCQHSPSSAHDRRRTASSRPLRRVN
jgi:hypothetical protein